MTSDIREMIGGLTNKVSEAGPTIDESTAMTYETIAKVRNTKKKSLSMVT